MINRCLCPRSQISTGLKIKRSIVRILRTRGNAKLPGGSLTPEARQSLAVTRSVFVHGYQKNVAKSAKEALFP